MKRLMKKLSKQVYPSLRMRRLRNNSGIRKLISETKLSVENLIQPIFVTEGKNKTEKITSLPGIYRYSEDNLLKEIKKLDGLGIIAVALFPNISKNNKSESAGEAYNNDCLLYTSDAADEEDSVDLGGRRIIKKSFTSTFRFIINRYNCKKCYSSL